MTAYFLFVHLVIHFWIVGVCALVIDHTLVPYKLATLSCIQLSYIVLVSWILVQLVSLTIIC